MKFANVEIKSEGPMTHLYIDGKEVTNATKATIKLNAANVPTMTVTYVLESIGGTLGCAHVRRLRASWLLEALRRQGNNCWLDIRRFFRNRSKHEDTSTRAE